MSILSLLNRISSGLIFLDKFDKTELNSNVWQASPTDSSRYSLTERSGFLRLKHGSPDLFVLMDTPRSDFVLEIDTEYDPVRPSDQGGIVAYMDNNTYIEMVEYYDAETGLTKTFDKLRMVKRSELYEGYGSNDHGNTWELIGTAYMSAPKVGFVLHGISEVGSDVLDIDECRIYRSTKLQIGNVSPGQTIKFFSDTGVLLAEKVCDALSDHIDIDVTNMKFPLKGHMELFDDSGFLLDTTEPLTDIWGGDVFWYGLQLDLEIDGLLMKQDREYQLGNMHGGIIERKGYIINNNTIPVTSVSASVMKYVEYKGWEWVDIALDNFGEPGVYKDNIKLGTINPGDRIPIWIKATRQSLTQVASLHDYKFRLVFESEGI